MIRLVNRFLTGIFALIPLCSAPLEGQVDSHRIPRRPTLPIEADSNSAVEYFRYGLLRLANSPGQAAAAFYWASRFDPYWAEPLNARSVALVLERPNDLLDVYMLPPARLSREELGLEEVDSMVYMAVLRDPWANRRIEAALIGAWLNLNTDGRGIPTYLREDFPSLDGRLSYAEGKYDQSVQQFAAAIVKDSSNQELRYLQALAWIGLGNTDSAAAAIRRALSTLRTTAAEDLRFTYVGYPFLEYSLGALFERTGQPDSARAAYERALLDDLTFAPAHRKLGALRVAAGDTTGALEEYEQAVGLDSSDVLSLYEFAVLSLAAGEAEVALPLLRRVIVAEPWFAKPHLVIARLYDASGYREEAVQEYRAFLGVASRGMASQAAAVRQRLDALGVAGNQ